MPGSAAKAGSQSLGVGPRMCLEDRFCLRILGTIAGDPGTLFEHLGGRSSPRACVVRGPLLRAWGLDVRVGVVVTADLRFQALIAGDDRHADRPF